MTQNLPFRFCVAPKVLLEDGSLNAKQCLFEAFESQNLDFVNSHVSYSLIYSRKGTFSIWAYAPDIDGQFSTLAFQCDIETDQVFLCERHPLARIHYNHREAKKIAIKLGTEDQVSSPVAYPAVIQDTYRADDKIEQLAVEFSENSVIHLPQFLTNSFLESARPELDSKPFSRIGPADYRCFEACAEASVFSSFFSDTKFLLWLSQVTGLTLLFPLRSVYIRRIHSAGDYQILHGNYSEPLGVDIVFNWMPSLPDSVEWPEDSLGRIHYLNEDGVELYQAPQHSNSLVVVYRTEGTSRFTENVRGRNNPLLYQVIATFAVAEDDDPAGRPADCSD